jgi:hypothetical protein
VKKILTLRFLQTITLIVVLAGAVGSLFYVVNAGRNNNSVLLRTLFVIWVLSPFIAFLSANLIFKRWTVFTHVTLYCLMLLVTLGSLVSYSGAFSTPKTKPAFMFLIVPFISWLLIMIVILAVRKLSQRESNT